MKNSKSLLAVVAAACATPCAAENIVADWRNNQRLDKYAERAEQCRLDATLEVRHNGGDIDAVAQRCITKSEPSSERKARLAAGAAAKAWAPRSDAVNIGMTQAEVVATKWGKPQQINRSVYAFGVHEQWVYGNRQYLYFEDGVLKTIQTSK